MTPRSTKALVAAALCAAALNSCEHLQKRAEQPSITTEKMTVATAQRHIRIGMSSSDVISALGSPNMVTTDDKRRETWAYDKISSDAVDTSSTPSTGLILLPVYLLVGHEYQGTTFRSSRNQRTLTIVIKFDEHSKVRDFAYHSSSF